MEEYDLAEAHQHSIYNVQEINDSFLCGCFSCLKTYKPNLIRKWADNDQTAVCPKCSADSVIGSASGFPVTDKDFLAAMYHKYFN